MCVCSVLLFIWVLFKHNFFIACRQIDSIVPLYGFAFNSMERCITFLFPCAVLLSLKFLCVRLYTNGSIEDLSPKINQHQIYIFSSMRVHAHTNTHAHCAQIDWLIQCSNSWWKNIKCLMFHHEISSDVKIPWMRWLNWFKTDVYLNDGRVVWFERKKMTGLNERKETISGGKQNKGWPSIWIHELPLFWLKGLDK